MKTNEKFPKISLQIVQGPPLRGGTRLRARIYIMRPEAKFLTEIRTYYRILVMIERVLYLETDAQARSPPQGGALYNL